MNINTNAYWEGRFKTNDWRRRGGNIQSNNHAKLFVDHLGIPGDFSGTICDVGCAEGDAFPVYKNMWPKAKLTGIDFAKNAIERAQTQYGHFVNFRAAEFCAVDRHDIIISSHTFEHLEDHVEVLDLLRRKCNQLFIIVPFREEPLGREHLRTYDEETYKEQNPKRYSVCDAGWQHLGIRLIYEIYIKNMLRPLIGKNATRMPKQIVFEFEGIR